MSAIVRVVNANCHLLKASIKTGNQSILTRLAMSTSTARSSPVKVDNLLIIGSGLMGSGIAQSSALSGKFQSIVLNDVSNEQLDIAKTRMTESLLRVKKKNPALDEKKIIDSITWSTKIEPKTDSNLLIIEAVPEKLELKQQLFKDLYERFGQNDSVILATNTSSLPCRDIGKYVAEKKRFAGLHFFNPVVLMKLVEIVRVDNGTDDATYNALVQYVKDIGKVGVTCKDTPGFIVNRLLIPYMYDSLAMYERGDATTDDIDTAMKLGTGYPMGPFELMDYTGLDTAKFIGDTFIDPLTGKSIVTKSKLIEKMVNEGKLGKKSGEGFYKYNKDGSRAK